MKQDFKDFLVEAEIMAETPRSLDVFKKVSQKKGHPLTFYDIFDYTDALKSAIKPSEIVQDMKIDVQALITRVKEMFSVDIRPDMSVSQIEQML